MKKFKYLIGTLKPSFDSSESLSELDDDSLLEVKAFSNSEVSGCKILGEQQQHCQPEFCAFNKQSSPRFFFIQDVQNKFLHDPQLTKSPIRPHHPQKHSAQSGSYHINIIVLILINDVYQL